MFQQDLQAVADSLFLSALCGAIPLLTLFVLLGGLKLRAWVAGLISLLVAILVAVVLFGMPVGQALLAGTEGAAFGFFPILWIVINAIWVYNLTVTSGHFDVLRRSFEKVSPDQRIQAIIIAFCFGALLEALAGFGTPVAITVVMLMALGFEPIKAAAVALIANTAPVAFGALATPIVTLAEVSSGASNDPGLTVDTLGVDGRPADPDPGHHRSAGPGVRRRRQAWRQADLDTGPGVRRRLRSRTVRRGQLHLRPAGRHRGRAGGGGARRPAPACLAAQRGAVRRAGRTQVRCEAHRRAPQSAPAATRRRCPARRAEVRRGAAGTGGAPMQDSGAEVAKAYAPYVVIIAIFSITNITAVKEFLAEKPFTYRVPVAGTRCARTPRGSRSPRRRSTSTGFPPQAP